MRAASIPATPDWGMKREMLSQSFTTRIDQHGRFSASVPKPTVKHMGRQTLWGISPRCRRSSISAITAGNSAMVSIR